MNRPRRNAIGRLDHETTGEAPAPRSIAWLALILLNIFGHTIRQVATEGNGDVSWLNVIIVLALVGLIVTVGLALRAARRRRTRTNPVPVPPWMSPMYDPWLDG